MSGCGILAESENARVPSMTVLVILVECQAWLLEGHDRGEQGWETGGTRGPHVCPGRWPQTSLDSHHPIRTSQRLHCLLCSYGS